MLDYKKLSNGFSAKLQQFDEIKLLEWLEFDNNRNLLSKLLNGETVSLKLVTTEFKKIDDFREAISNLDNNEFAFAA